MTIRQLIDHVDRFFNGVPKTKQQEKECMELIISSRLIFVEYIDDFRNVYLAYGHPRRYVTDEFTGKSWTEEAEIERLFVNGVDIDPDHCKTRVVEKLLEKINDEWFQQNQLNKD